MLLSTTFSIRKAPWLEGVKFNSRLAVGAANYVNLFCRSASSLAASLAPPRFYFGNTLS